MNNVRRLKILLSIATQTLRHNVIVIEIALSFLMVLGFASLIFRMARRGLALLAQVHRSTRLRSYRMLVEPFLKKRISLVRDRAPNRTSGKVDLYLGKRIMVLKRPGPFSERGVLYIMFNEVIEALPGLFNMQALLHDYYLVLEPSWSGYCGEYLLQYTKYQEEVFVSCPEDEDFNFLVRLDANLKPLPFGARDWVDPRLAERFRDPAGDKKFDIVMNSHWGWGKRHYVLFRKLKMLSDITVALIGVPWEGRSLENIETLSKYYNVEKQVTYFEGISYEEVMKVTSRSKIGLLLSLKEGGNRAMPECLFCDIPVIVLTRNVGGVKKIINPLTGLAVTEDNLVWAVRYILDNLNSYTPRKWAIENISCTVTTSLLNNYLCKHALTHGQPWTRDIVPRTNAPESHYYKLEDEQEFKEANLGLKQYFKG